MLVEGLSLIASLSNAGSSVLISKGMSKSNPYNASLQSTIVQAGVLTLILFSDIPTPNWRAITLFTFSGVMAIGFGRLLYFMSMEKIGVATSSAIIGSNPLITTLLAIIILGEVVNISILVGSFLVGLGIFIINSVKGSFQIDKGVLISLFSAIAYAFSNVIRKMGLNIQPNSILGAQVIAFSGSISFLIYLIFINKLSEVRLDTRSTTYFIAAGAISSIGWIAFMKAMELGSVSVVSTIVFSYPLFSIFLSWLFLRDDEDISLGLVIGCIIIVLGVVVVSIF